MLSWWCMDNKKRRRWSSWLPPSCISLYSYFCLLDHFRIVTPQLPSSSSYDHPEISYELFALVYIHICIAYWIHYKLLHYTLCHISNLKCLSNFNLWNRHLPYFFLLLFTTRTYLYTLYSCSLWGWSQQRQKRQSDSEYLWYNILSAMTWLQFIQKNVSISNQ